MYAERFLPPKLYRLPLLAFLLMITGLTGCKTEKDPDDPTVLGRPAPRAYLGVEYYYNFGAYGGERILDYSLTNAPSWLALEDTSNKARQGIIMRGVPGLTGGNRGKSDLGTTENVTLLTTDGREVGVQPFKIEVRQNVLSLEAEGFEEGVYPEAREQEGEEFCQLPDLGEVDDPDDERRTGSHTFTKQIYGEDGQATGEQQRTKPTTPVLVRVQLDQPSVTRIKVAFELDSDFDPEACDSDLTPPHQRCTHSNVNRGRAIIGQDIVGLGSASADKLPVPDYLRYLPDAEGNLTKGVLTLEPGITDCYIRLEVVSDDVPEELELFTMTLTDVREGLASVGSADEGVTQTLRIRDQETVVSFETLSGAARDVINANETRTYVAKLANRLDQDATYRVRLGEDEGTSAEPGVDYIVQLPDPEQEGAWVTVEELEFPAGQDRLEFRIEALNQSQVEVDNDKLIILNADERFQDGREFYAATQETGLRLSINELVSALEVGGAGDFIPTDMATARDGQIALVGVDVTGALGEGQNAVWLIVYDRKGAMIHSGVVAEPMGDLEASPPVVAYNERSAEVGDATITQRELAVAYGSRASLAGSAQQGGLDAITVLLRFDSASLNPYVMVWQTQTGTAGNDVPRGAVMDRQGNVFVAGETTGAWHAGSSRGRIDTYVQRIGTELDGNNEIAKVAWTRQVGSALDDVVNNVSVQNSSALVMGNSSGSVEGEPQLGGRDLFFYTAATADGRVTVRQRGTQANEAVHDALLAGSTLWFAVSPEKYTRQEQVNENNNEIEAFLTSQALGSEAASVLAYNTSGNSEAALTLNDVNDNALDHFRHIVSFNSGVVTGGKTTGQFDPDLDTVLAGSTPMLARFDEIQPEPEPEDEGEDNNAEGSDGESEDGVNVIADQDDQEQAGPVVAPGIEERWRAQPAIGNALVDGLIQYRGDKLISLIQRGSETSRTWDLVLFSGEGRQLNPATP
ncbi:hypothetical protein [Marinobacter salicampi]|uniref:hypothetical protein n=1 Tax=Marinobacter salicampi TaxID=435907 RepID=UPI001408A23E|nr:hypothetical protein [Marinobacter salicampi]